MNAEAALYIAIRQNRTAAMGRTLGELKILFCQAVVKYIRLLPTAASNSGKGEPRERQSAKEITDHVCVCDCGGGGRKQRPGAFVDPVAADRRTSIDSKARN